MLHEELLNVYEVLTQTRTPNMLLVFIYTDTGNNMKNGSNLMQVHVSVSCVVSDIEHSFNLKCRGAT